MNARELLRDLLDDLRTRATTCRTMASATNEGGARERLLAKAATYEHAAQLLEETIRKLDIEQAWVMATPRELGARAYRMVVACGEYSAPGYAGGTLERIEWEAGWAHEKTAWAAPKEGEQKATPPDHECG